MLTHPLEWTPLIEGRLIDFVRGGPTAARRVREAHGTGVGHSLCSPLP